MTELLELTDRFGSGYRPSFSNGRKESSWNATLMLLVVIGTRKTDAGSEVG